MQIIPIDEELIYYDNKFILKKSDPMSNDFDTLLLDRRDIENVKTTAFIQLIEHHAFDNCSKIKSIEFSNNSNSKLIGMYSFCLSSNRKHQYSIECYLKSKKFAFSDCSNLKNIGFSSESKLKLIIKFAFGQYSRLKNVDFLDL